MINPKLFRFCIQSKDYNINTFQSNLLIVRNLTLLLLIQNVISKESCILFFILKDQAVTTIFIILGYISSSMIKYLFNFFLQKYKQNHHDNKYQINIFQISFSKLIQLYLFLHNIDMKPLNFFLQNHQSRRKENIFLILF